MCTVATPAGRILPAGSLRLREIQAFTRGIAVAIPCRVMNAMPQPTASLAAPVASGTPAGYHGAVSDFKRRLIETTLHETRGNRTHAARTLGLQRTYLLRLIRDLGVAAPPPAARGRTAEHWGGETPPQSPPVSREQRPPGSPGAPSAVSPEHV